jgi:UDP-N-acetylmuramoylalanine--D-glutamate ligase
VARVRKITVGILGLSKSGLAAAKLYKSKGFDIVGFDDNSNLTLSNEYSSIFKDLYLGKQPSYVFNEIKNYKLMIVSPGIPFDHEVIRVSNSFKIPVISEIEAAYKFLPEPKNIIAITGTNGKSTITFLIYQILKNHKVNSFLGGNIGIPFSDVVLDIINNENTINPVVVLEVSSFQLKFTNNFRSKIAVITNIKSDHLDRHSSFEDYANSKLKLFNFQAKKDFAFVNLNDEVISSNLSKLNSNILLFSNNDEISSFNLPKACKKVYIVKSKDDNIQIYFACFNGLNPIKIDKFSLIFEFNISKLDKYKTLLTNGFYRENILIATLVSYVWLQNYEKIKLDKDILKEVIDNFEPLSYRLDNFIEINNILFFNDSKATNFHALVSSLKTAFEYMNKLKIDYKVILLIGGYLKYLKEEEAIQDLLKNINEIKDYHEKFIAVLGFGKGSNSIISAFAKSNTNFGYLYSFPSLEYAFDKAINLAQDYIFNNSKYKVAILFIPGAASFDQFKSAEERGKFFDNLVNQFKINFLAKTK